MMNSFSHIANDYFNKISKNKNNLISNDQIINFDIKNEQIEDWIAHHQSINEDKNLCTKSTQTHISTIKSGSAWIREAHHMESTVTPSIFTTSKYASYNEEPSIIKLHLFNLYNHHKKLKLRFNKLYEDFQKMNEVAEVLTISLENSVQGKPINLDMILQSCLKIFPDRFNRNVQSHEEDVSKDLKEDVLKDIFIIQDEQNIVNNISVPSKQLDYKKIKFHLTYGDTKTKLLLLQALRQKLTLNEAENRDDILYDYITEDLLELQDNALDNNENNNLHHLLQPINLKISTNLMQQTTSRFLNTLASLSCGRNYLSSSLLVSNIIIIYLNSCQNGIHDDVTLDMLLATLQKMSLRKKQRNFMIKINLVEWLIHHLNTEYLRMRTYRLEYVCALLMNLSLHSSARFRAAVIAPLFISTMKNLLSTDCSLVLPYINGALQNFLLDNDINEEAKKLRLLDILEDHCLKSDEELRNHFLHTLKIHKRECNENLSDDDELPDEDDELFNSLENELEEDDPVQALIGELQGENLLATYYSVFLPQSKQSFNKKLVGSTSDIEIDNFPSKKSKKTELNVKKKITVNETKFNDSKIETMDKKINAEVVASKQILRTNKSKMRSQEEEEEDEKEKEEEKDAFLAKPKLMRTPPPSDRGRTDPEKLIK